MLTAILLATICTVTSLPSVLGVDFSILIKQEEVFQVDIVSDSTETHDVKIFFRQGGDTLKSETSLGEEWKNAYYYLISAFPESKSYYARLKDEILSETEICVRLRKSGGSSFSEQCESLNTQEESQESLVDAVQTQDKQDIQQEQLQPQPIVSQISTKDPNNEPIILRQSKKEEVQYTVHGKTRIFINYLLAAVAFIALFLIVNKKHREL